MRTSLPLLWVHATLCERLLRYGFVELAGYVDETKTEEPPLKRTKVEVAR